MGVDYSKKYAALTGATTENRGLTLVELMLSLALMTILAAAVFQMLLGANSHLAGAGYRTAAVNLCREKMEEAKSRDFMEKLPPGLPGGEYREEEDMGGYRRETVVSRETKNVPRQGGKEPLELVLYRLKVEVLWEEQRGEQSVKLESYLEPRP